MSKARVTRASIGATILEISVQRAINNNAF